MDIYSGWNAYRECQYELIPIYEQHDENRFPGNRPSRIVGWRFAIYIPFCCRIDSADTGKVTYKLCLPAESFSGSEVKAAAHAKTKIDEVLYEYCAFS